MKATIGMLEILAMGITYHTPALRGEHKVLVLGLGANPLHLTLSSDPYHRLELR